VRRVAPPDSGTSSNTKRRLKEGQPGPFAGTPRLDAADIFFRLSTHRYHRFGRLLHRSSPEFIAVAVIVAVKPKE